MSDKNKEALIPAAKYFEEKLANLRLEEAKAKEFNKLREAEHDSISTRLANIQLQIVQYNLVLETIRIDIES